MRNLILAVAAGFLFSSCVAKRYLIQSQEHVAQLQSDSTKLQNNVYSLMNQMTKLEENASSLKSNIAKMESNIAELNKKIANLNTQNVQLGKMTEEQQSLLDRSKQDLVEKQERLQQLENLLLQQKQASAMLKNKMSDALTGYNSNDLTVYQKNGKVYVSLSENLLFPSGSAVVNQNGVDALSKLAIVLNSNPDVSIQVEGNTDSIPIRGRYPDNWELSTARANAIVRILVDKYDVNPTNVIAVGHSYYDPVATNSTPEGRALNRRTDIVLSPNLQELYQLLDSY